MISTLRVRLPAVVTALAVAALLAGCRFDPYCINRCPGLDGSIDAMAPDVQPYDIVLSECVPRGPEICDGVDNDCNGQIDDGVLPGIGATCGVTRGQCHEGVAQCVSGAIECVGSVDPRAEECNGLDDDCDRVIDNGNPGGDLPCNQTAGGMDDRHNGRGDCRLGVSACVSGHLLCQGGVLPGAEVCDARDNDCNGVIDDGNPSGGGTCGVAAGACAPGVLHCISGALACIGAGIPSAEACDLADNDCDGLIDEDFDLRTDARNCGACGHACTAPSAIGNCTAGACVVAACEPGHIDLDGIYTNGCEYLCDYTGVELCDGRDNDCNGQIDEALTAPANLCRPLGECARAVPACRGTTGWGCNYPLTVSLDASGNIIPETQCDELDNDCNGRVDDTFSTKGSACSRGLGVCTTHGTFACNAAHDGVACQAADPAAGTPEACNGLDDDCNGLVDDNAPDAWVNIQTTFGTSRMYAYEASRPDADGTTAGTMAHRPCSAAGRLPWVNVTAPQAAAACVAIGARLCYENEWQGGCEGNAVPTCTYAYGAMCTTYQPNTCNGNDYDSDPARPGDQDSVYPTGHFGQCYMQWGSDTGARLFDMSGNVKEWTAPRAAGINPLRGGSYNNPQAGLACSYNFTLADDAFLFSNVGFRCCQDVP